MKYVYWGECVFYAFGCGWFLARADFPWLIFFVVALVAFSLLFWHEIKKKFVTGEE